MESLKNKILSSSNNLIFLAGFVLCYFLLCYIFQNTIGTPIFILALAPAAFAGWKLGSRYGMLTALLILLLNFLFFLPNQHIGAALLLQQLPLAAAAVAAGGLAGRVNQRITKAQLQVVELGKERFSLLSKLRERSAADAENKKNIELTETLLENINEVVFHVDADLKLTYLNNAWIELSEYSVKEVLGTPLINYLSEDEKEKGKLFFSQTLKDAPTDAKFITVFLTKQAEQKQIEVHCKQVLEKDNRFAGIIGTLRDVTELMQTEENLQLRARFEKLIATISTTFINLPVNKIDQALNAALKVIAMFFAVDRSYLFFYSEEKNTYFKTHEWIAEGINLAVINSQKKDSKPFKYIETKLEAFETIYIPDVAALPEEAASVKNILERRKIKSIVFLPLLYSKELLGFLCFDAILEKKEFSSESLQLLKVITDIFANAYQNKKREEEILALNQSLETRVARRTKELEAANEELKNEIIERTKIQHALAESETRYRTLFESNPYPMWVYDQETLKFLTVNDMAVKHYGYSREEFLSMTLKDIRPTSEIHTALEYLSKPLPEIDYAGIWKHLKKDGTFIDVEKITHSINFGEKPARLVLALDVTERMKAERQLQASLNEKEIMIKEIHHRVKNNLQIISSLLTLQSEFIKDTSAKEYFTDSQNRVKSMAIIHEKLYQTRDFANINIKDYVDNLTLSLFRAYNISSAQIDVEIVISDISLDVDTAIPCGLIINELVSNSLKYAFSNQRKGKMIIKLIPVDEDKLQLMVCDNGVGLPKELDLTKMQSLGLSLVNILSKQLNGEVQISNAQGAKFIITFSKPYIDKG